MHGTTLVLGVLALSFLVLPCEARAGWVIEQVAKGGGEERQQVILQSNRMKTVSLEDGAPAAAIIIDLEASTITTVDYRERSYRTGTVREYAETVRGMRQMAGRQMAELKKQMEAAMKDMPPEQRRMVHEMMRQQLGDQADGEQDCGDSQFELRPTAETARIAGFRATRHDLITDGKPDSQVWLARELTAWRELDLQKLQRVVAELAAGVACSADTGAAGAAAAWRAVKDGYPVRVADTSGTVVEVVNAESRAIPASEFQPPPGFTRKPLAETGSR